MNGIFPSLRLGDWSNEAVKFQRVQGHLRWIESSLLEMLDRIFEAFEDRLLTEFYAHLPTFGDRITPFAPAISIEKAGAGRHDIERLGIQNP